MLKLLLALAAMVDCVGSREETTLFTRILYVHAHGEYRTAAFAFCCFILHTFLDYVSF